MSKLTPEVKAKIQERLDRLAKINCIDALKPNSRPTTAQQEVLDDYLQHKYKSYWVLGGNQSGKSALLRKVFAWFLAEGQPDIPYVRRPEWEGPLQALLVSKNHKQLTESILPGILKFFGEDEIRIVRNANYVEKLVHKATGNTVICAVHENASQCRERVQSFTLHLVGLDELPAGPAAYKLVEELEARVMLYHGCLFSSFTPKSINKMIKEHVETSAPPFGKKYTLRFVDNPAADTETIEARLQQISHMPEHVQKTLLEGNWAQAESTVYQLTDYALQGPVNYSPLWRHVLGVDPGIASKQGFVVAAEDPTTGRWYVIHSEAHDKIDDVDDAVKRVADYVVASGVNVVKIAYDAAGNYWYKSARKHPILSRYKIECPFNKNSTSRKEDMISAVQTSIGATLFVAPWNEDLIEEFGSYHWSETQPGKIVKSQKYHLLDALRYMVDLLPKFIPNQPIQQGQDMAAQMQMEIRKYNMEARERAAARRAEDSKGGNWRKQSNTTWRGGKITIKR
jgi:hypothetical protein